MEEAQKYTITEILYFTRDTHPTREDVRRANLKGPLGPFQGSLERPRVDKGKKSMFDQYSPVTTTRRKIQTKWKTKIFCTNPF